MKYLTVLGLIGICALGGSLALVPPHNKPAVVPTPPPAPTLAQDLDEILRMIPFISIRGLTTRYLLNDEQFQAFVRIINSYDAYITQMRFRSQPEVMAFLAWARSQIMLSGGELQIEESEEFLSIINRTPFWANTVFGWQGFVNEFKLYYPQDMIRTHIQMKVAQNGIFTQFVQRLKALKPVYERVIAMPEAQRVSAALQANGINPADLDTFIRDLFGWQNPPTVAPPVSSTASAVPVAPVASEAPVASASPVAPVA